MRDLEYKALALSRVNLKVYTPKEKKEQR